MKVESEVSFQVPPMDLGAEFPHGKFGTCIGISFETVFEAPFGKLDAIYFHPHDIDSSLLHSLSNLFRSDKPILVGGGVIRGILHDA